MLAILDDVLDEKHRQAVIGFFTASEEARGIKWHPCVADELRSDQSPLALLLKKASNYFDLSSMVGSEYWAHYGTRPDWHVDKDEKLYEQSKVFKYPICSIVYYADINVVGGNFVTETSMIKPVTNRMLIFSPNLLHCVEPYTGTRLSVAVNPWSDKPLTCL